MKHKLDFSRKGAHALLIRHAERDPILPGDSVWNAKLTQQGRLDALDFGSTFCDFSFGGAYSSPIQRCRDTASLMLDGWGQSGKPVQKEDPLLGIYIHDNSLAKVQFEENDPWQLILDHIDGRKFPGFHSLEEGSNLLLEFVRERMSPQKLTLFVSHDALLMPFKAHFQNETYSQDEWIPFLGNVAISCDETGTYLDGVKI